MAYTRETAVTYLNSEFDELAADAGITPDDSGWTTVIDRMLRVDTDDEETQEALMDYYALRWIARKFSIRFAVSKTGLSVSLNQAFTQVKALLDDATKRLESLGLLPGGGGGWAVGSLNLDFLEPAGDF